MWPWRRDRLSWPVWLAFAYAGVVLPVICHAMTVTEPPSIGLERWQTGNLHDQLAFVLSGSAGYAFYPLMLLPMTCLALLLWREAGFAHWPVVRFGVATGMPVAMWYGCILGLVILEVPRLVTLEWLRVLVVGLIGLAAPLVGWGLLQLCVLVLHRLDDLPWSILGVILLTGALASLPLLAEFWLAVVAAAFYFSLFFAPWWAFGTYLAMTVRLLWRYPRPLRFSMLHMLAAMSWLAAFLAACRWSVLESLRQYALLPVSDPGNCYIATAAAHGHPWLVKSRAARASDGSLVRVNRQLAVLKAGELALRAVAPGTHRVLRRMYDQLGPAAARRVRNCYLADLAYVLLKPAEWSTYVGLVAVLGSAIERIDDLYRGVELTEARRPGPRTDNQHRAGSENVGVGRDPVRRSCGAD